MKRKRTYVYVVFEHSYDSNTHEVFIHVQNVFRHLKDAQVYVDNMYRFGVATMYIKKFVLL